MDLAREIRITDLGSYEQAWRTRQNKLWRADPAASWEWIEAGADALGPNEKLLLLGSESAPVGILKIVKRVGIKLAVPLGSGLDRMAWCPGSTSSDAAAALEAGRPLASFWLPYMEEESIDESVGRVTRNHGQYLTIEGTDWTAYMESRSGSLRRTLRKATTRIHQNPKVAIKVLDVGETSHFMKEFSEVEKNGHRRAGHMLSSRNGGQSFAARVLSSLDRSGSVRTLAAFDRQGPCAYLFGVTAGGRFLAYTTATHERSRDLALGHLLLSECIQLAMDRGEVIDLGNGSTEFKRRWATSSRPLRDIFVGGNISMMLARCAFKFERRMRAASKSKTESFALDHARRR